MPSLKMACYSRCLALVSLGMKTPWRSFGGCLHKFSTFTSCAFALIVLCGCMITRDVTSVPHGRVIDKIYIVENPKVCMSGFLPELKSQIENLGFVTSVVVSRELIPQESYSLEYTANWRWDFAEYLTYFNAQLKFNDDEIGSITYNTAHGCADLNMSKWGHTRDKIRPLLIKLLENARPAAR